MGKTSWKPFFHLPPPPLKPTTKPYKNCTGNRLSNKRSPRHWTVARKTRGGDTYSRRTHYVVSYTVASTRPAFEIPALLSRVSPFEKHVDAAATPPHCSTTQWRAGSLNEHCAVLARCQSAVSIRHIFTAFLVFARNNTTHTHTLTMYVQGDCLKVGHL